VAVVTAAAAMVEEASAAVMAALVGAMVGVATMGVVAKAAALMAARARR